MQTSHVLDQHRWFGAGDVDDCWVVSAIQCVMAVTPWVYLPNVTSFRKAAGDPDDGQSDGGTLAEIVKGVTGLWPEYAGRMRQLRGVVWGEFLEHAQSGVPISVAVISGKLPAFLQYGFTGPESYHQVSVYQRANVQVANPLAPVYSRWADVVSWEVLRPAIMSYGQAKAGRNGAWAVVFPSEVTMLPTHPKFMEAMALYEGPALQAARAQGYAQAKSAAVAAVEGI